MTPWPPHDYLSAALAAGLTSSEAELALQTAWRVQRRGLPALLTLGHLAREVSLRYGALRAFANREIRNPYRHFTIHKRDGSLRDIYVPTLDLFRVQKWISANILSKVKAHPASFAYAPESSIRSCAAMHCGARWLLKIDIKNFFESITEKQVFYVFRSLDYPALISFEMARLCTRVAPPRSSRYRSARWRVEDNKEVPDSLVYSQHYIGFLPQGAPSSPMLSNLVVRSLDDKFDKIAQERHMYYSRYADDIVFSSSQTAHSREILWNLAQCVFSVLRDAGFQPNSKKTLIVPPGARKIVLGLLVDGKTPRLTREFKNRIDQHVYCIQKNGWLEHMKKRSFRSVFSLDAHVRGLLAHATQVEPKWAEPYLKTLNSIPIIEENKEPFG